MKAFFNRVPLNPNSRVNLSLGRIKPEGWLKRQLLGQAATAEKLFDRLSVDENGSIKANLEKAALAYEALVYVAFTLEDEILKHKASEYTQKLIASQTEDGRFAGADEGDYWPLMLFCRGVYVYFTATGDRNALILIDGFLKYEYRNLDKLPLEKWACARASESLYMALKLYNITGQKYLIDLCRKLKNQSLDWTNIFNTFPNIQPMSKSMTLRRLNEGMEGERNDLKGEDHPFFATYFHQSQGTNVAIGLKAPGVISAFKTGFKEQNGFKYGWEKLVKYHGTASGMFTSDEHLNGNNPSAGIGTEAVAETMRSLETLLDLGSFGSDMEEILEKIAYNDLPAAFSKSGDMVQPLQQTNQINCSDTGHDWYNAPNDANVFSSNPEKTAMSEAVSAFASFASCLWQATSDDGLSAVSYAPCKVSCVIDTVPVRLNVGGNYPFGDTVDMEINVKKPIEFPLYLRIPSWAISPMIHLPNGEIMTVRAGETACLRQKWEDGNKIKLVLPKQPRITKWSRQSAAVEFGALLMALPLNADEITEADENGNTALKYTLSGDWSFALITGETMKPVYDDEGMDYFKSGDAPLKLMTKVCKTDAWQRDGKDAGSIPIAPTCGKDAKMTATLVPYGYTDLRICQFPMAKTEE